MLRAGGDMFATDDNYGAVGRYSTASSSVQATDCP